MSTSIRGLRWLLVGSLSLGSVVAAAPIALAGPPRIDAAENGAWVEGHYDVDGNWIEGYTREGQRDGFSWVDAYVDEDGTYVPAHWEPIQARDGYTWEWGWREDTGDYYPGFWRENSQDGYEWVDGGYAGGTYQTGYWRPLIARPGYVWVAGYVNPEGYWTLGHWRQPARVGYTWVDGYVADGLWYAGYWAPVETRAGFVWVPGYATTGVWYEGYWRPGYRPGYSWVGGAWAHGRWSAGYWHHGVWRAPAGYRPAYYANYSWEHGHNYNWHHRRVWQARYAAHHTYATAHARPMRSTTPHPRPINARPQPRDYQRPPAQAHDGRSNGGNRDGGRRHDRNWEGYRADQGNASRSSQPARPPVDSGAARPHDGRQGASRFDRGTQPPRNDGRRTQWQPAQPSPVQPNYQRPASPNRAPHTWTPATPTPQAQPARRPTRPERTMNYQPSQREQPTDRGSRAREAREGSHSNWNRSPPANPQRSVQPVPAPVKTPARPVPGGRTPARGGHGRR